MAAVPRRPLPDRATLAVALLLWLGTIAAELARGRPPICPCGKVRLWWGVVQSPENSQQVADWYSFSHLIHGFLAWGAGWWVVRRFPRFPARWVFPLAVAVECTWELIENSPLVIDRYRAETVSFGYAGDSVLNSASDILFMALGFAMAARLRWWQTLALGIGFELLTLAVIRDNLTLNVLMLVWPVAAIRAWQARG